MLTRWKLTRSEKLIGESGLEQMKKDMAVQKAVTVIADAAIEVEKAADAE